MKRTTKVLVAAVPFVSAVSALSVGSASAGGDAAPVPTGPPVATQPVPTAEPVPTAPVAPTAPLTPTAPVAPTAYTLVSDNTGLLNVEVPQVWSQVDTRPFINDDNTLRPAITASSVDFDTWLDSYAYGGFVYEAYAPATTEAAAFAGAGDPTRCTDGGRTPYNDGAFVGELQAWNFCDGGQSREFVLVVRPTGGEFLALLWAKTTGPQDEVSLQHVLETFNAVPSIGLPTETAPPDTTVAPGPTAPGTTIAAVPTAPPPVPTGPPVPTAVPTTPVTAAPITIPPVPTGPPATLPTPAP